MSGFIIQFSETHEPLSRDVSCDGVTRNRVRLREIKLISHPAEARLRNLYGSIERSAVPRLAIEQFDRSLDVYREYLEPPQRHERGLHNAVSKKRSHIFTSIARIPIDPYPYPSAASSPPSPHSGKNTPLGIEKVPFRGEQISLRSDISQRDHENEREK